jgi:hypothetical protein
MEKHHLVLIGGALALLLYVKHKHKGGAASVAASNSANASTQYTTAQAPQAAQWWNYAGSWATA